MVLRCVSSPSRPHPLSMWAKMACVGPAPPWLDTCVASVNLAERGGGAESHPKRKPGATNCRAHT
eukprot:500647-Prorocentrum_minimum.AAC.1